MSECSMGTQQLIYVEIDVNSQDGFVNITAIFILHAINVQIDSVNKCVRHIS